MKIKMLLNIFVGIIAMLLVVGLIFTFQQLEEMNQDSHVVNLNGKLRALTFRIAQLSLEKSYGINTATEIERLAQEYDLILSGLIHGSKQLNLPPATNPQYRAELEKIQQIWHRYRQVLARVENNPELVDKLHDESTRLFQQANAATAIAARIASDHLADVKSTQTILFVINALVLLAILFVSMRKISLPLNALKDKAIQIASGEYDAVINTSSRDEIGDLARSFQAMVHTLKRKIQATHIIIETTIHAIEQHDLNSTYSTVVNGIQSLTEADSAVLIVMDPKTQQISEVKPNDLPDHLVNELVHRDAGHPLLMGAIQHQEFREWHASQPEFPAGWKQYGFQSVWVAPLIFMNATIACAIVLAKHQQWEDDTQHHLELISKLTAAAISAKFTISEVEKIRRYL